MEVVTDDEIYYADRVVVASDAWTNQVLAETGTQVPLTVTQEQVTYYATPNLREFAPENFPVFMWHGAYNFYGFPIYGEVATKLGQHMGGHEVTADTRTFEPDPVRKARYHDFLSRHLPGFLGPELYTKTCLYTIPPDQNFVIDTLPEHPQISVAIGAGHAYKFAGLIGRILSELALDGESTYPIEPFSIDAPGRHRPLVPESVPRLMDSSPARAKASGSTNGEIRATVRRDRRTVGRTGTLLERGVDFERLRRERLGEGSGRDEVRDIGALLLTDTMNIRYTTGVSVMPIWTASNLAHYVLVPAEGSPVVFEMARAKFRAEEFFQDVRNAYHWQARFAEQMAPERSVEWAADIKSVLEDWGIAGREARGGLPRLPRVHGAPGARDCGSRTPTSRWRRRGSSRRWMRSSLCASRPPSAKPRSTTWNRPSGPALASTSF